MKRRNLARLAVGTGVVVVTSAIFQAIALAADSWTKLRG